MTQPMDFLKKVLYSSMAYFIALIIWIQITGQKMNMLALCLQALSFGVIAGSLYLSITHKDSPITQNRFFKDEEESED